MKITRGDFSHSAIYATTWNQAGVIEAQKNGVNFKLWEVWVAKWGYEYVVFEPMFKYDEHELMIRAFSKAGETKYDFFTFFRRAFGNRKKRGYTKEAEKQICSEYCAWVWDIPEWYDITPQELYDYLVNSKYWELKK